MQSGEQQTPLRQRVLSGVIWSALSRVGGHVFSLISAIFVARVLAPQDYGLMNMAFILTTFVALFRDLGTTGAIIQKRTTDPALLSSVFWLNAGLGTAATLLCAAGAPLAAWFYREPAVTNIVRTIAITFLFSSVTAVHTAILNRDMRFRVLTAIELTAGASGLITAVTMAYSGAGVWSLVTASLVNAAITSLFTLAVVRWRPVAHYRWKDIKEFSSFGLNLTGFNVINFVGRNADNALIGRYAGPAALGVYQFAYMLMLLPLQNLTFMLSRVLFPAFSEMQDDKDRLRDAYVRASAVVAMIAFPMMAGIALLSAPLISVLLDKKWAEVAPLLTILAPVGLIQSVMSMVGQIYQATGRVDLLMRWGALSNAVVVASFVIGLPWGVRGVAAAYAIAITSLAIPTFYMAFRLIHLKMAVFGRMLLPYSAAAAGMAVAVAGLRYALEAAGASNLAVLLLCVTAGAAVYVMLLWPMKPAGLVEVLALISRSSATSPAAVPGTASSPGDVRAV